MDTVTTATGLRRRVERWRRAGQRTAFVPTMGNLHAGHLRLVARAREAAPRVVVSIFVNPLQFAPGEDYESYPRTLERDRAALAEADADLLFAPAVGTLYGGGLEQTVRVEVPGLSDILCGAARPGHFSGVATIVAKLFNLVQPDVAVFGEKDFQQLLVIRRMAAELCFPVEILGEATVREADGLAMSSRNAYLDGEQRKRAPALYRALCSAVERLHAAERDYRAIEEAGAEELRTAGLEPEYFSIRRARDLGPPQAGDPDLIVLAAARLGPARLIDNLRAGG